MLLGYVTRVICLWKSLWSCVHLNPRLINILIDMQQTMGWHEINASIETQSTVVWQLVNSQVSIDSIVLNDTRSIGCQPRCSLNIDQGLIEKQLREWIDTQLQMTCHIIQSFDTYRSENLSADTYRGGIGKEVWEMYNMPLSPDCYTRLHFEPKTLHYITRIPPSFTYKHTWIYQWMGYRPIL